MRSRADAVRNSKSQIQDSIFEVQKRTRRPQGTPGCSLAAAELPKQLRVLREFHPQKLLTAAHTYSLNGSRITSISLAANAGHRSCPAVADSFQGDCRPILGCDSRRHRDIDLSRSLYFSAAGLPLPETPSREQSAKAVANARSASASARHRPANTVRCRIHITMQTARGSKKIRAIRW